MKFFKPSDFEVRMDMTQGEAEDLAMTANIKIEKFGKRIGAHSPYGEAPGYIIFEEKCTHPLEAIHQMNVSTPNFGFNPGIAIFQCTYKCTKCGAQVQPKEFE